MSRNSDTFYQSAIVVAVDIRHSTAILEDLTASESAHQWRNVLMRIKAKIDERRTQDGFIPYKFLGDGWILIFKHDASAVDVFSSLVVIESIYDISYRAFVEPALKRKHPRPALSFGISRGRLVKFLMGEDVEFIGKPINEACRLQAAVGDSASDSLGLLDAGYYSEYKDDFQGIAIERWKSLKNVEGGQDIKCYEVPIEAAFQHLILRLL